MYLLLDKLKKIRTDLDKGAIDLSTAMLYSLCIVRNLLPESKNELTWLNREVLGYLDEEVTEMSHQLDNINLEDVHAYWEISLPTHRLIPGAWLAWHNTTQTDNSKKRKTIPATTFCSLGIIQIEQLLETGKSSKYLSLEYNKSLGYTFVCNRHELEILHNKVKEKLYQLIETTTAKLSLV